MFEFINRVIMMYNINAPVRARRIFLFILFSIAPDVSATATEDFNKELFQWEPLPSIERSLEGTSVGTDGTALFIIGGVESPADANQSRCLDSITVLEPGSSAWKIGFTVGCISSAKMRQK